MRLIMLASVLLLSACGSNKIDQEFTDGETGEKTRVSANMDGGSVALPANLPGYAAAYPGATISTVVSRPGENGGGLVSMSVKAAPQAVLDHYRRQGGAADMKVVTEVATGDARMLAMGKDGDDAAMQVTISPSGNDDGMLQVAVTYATPRTHASSN